jgi:Dullard-like phosphatase family protein
MKEGDSISEDESKQECELSQEPILNVIQQSSEDGTQKLPNKRFSLLLYFCECFRASQFSYFRRSLPILLPLQTPEFQGKNTLVLDLDETLVHSTFAAVPCEIRLPITIEDQLMSISVLKRPGLDQFLARCSAMFEVVIFTASLEVYASPLIDLLDPDSKIPYRLYRDSCRLQGNGYVKDLSRLGRDLKNVIIVDVRAI